MVGVCRSFASVRLVWMVVMLVSLVHDSGRHSSFPMQCNRFICFLPSVLFANNVGFSFEGPGCKCCAVVVSET